MLLNIETFALNWYLLSDPMKFIYILSKGQTDHPLLHSGMINFFMHSN